MEWIIRWWRLSALRPAFLRNPAAIDQYNREIDRYNKEVDRHNDVDTDED